MRCVGRHAMATMMAASTTPRVHGAKVRALPIVSSFLRAGRGGQPPGAGDCCPQWLGLGTPTALTLNLSRLVDSLLVGTTTLTEWRRWGP